MRIHQANSFNELQPIWNSCLKRCHDNNPFLTWEWLSTWWEFFGKNKELLLLTLEDAGRVIAIAPLMRTATKIMKLQTVRKIEFIGSPESDYSNFIITEQEKECLKEIFKYLQYAFPDWDFIELRELRETSSTTSAIKETLSDKKFSFSIKQRQCSICPYIPLPQTFQALTSELDKKTQQTLNRHIRKLNRDFSVQFKSYREFGYTAQEAMKLFVKVHEMRWVPLGVPYALANENIRAFHLALADLLDKNSCLSLQFLKLNGEIVAGLYGFNYEQTLYGYLTGFDPKYATYAVGNLSMYFLMDDCIKREFVEMDLLRGDEPYKSHITRTYRTNSEIRVIKKNAKYYLYEQYEHALKTRDATKKRISQKKTTNNQKAKL